MSEVMNEVINNFISIIFHAWLCYTSLLKPEVFTARIFKNTSKSLIALSYLIGILSLVRLISIAYIILG